MILVVGGIASGKRTFALSLGYPESDIAFDAHELARDAEHADELVSALEGKAIVTCAEVGNGIVPLDAGERAWRERVGRMCSALAERADAVVRMVCGVPVVLKGSVESTEGNLTAADDRSSEAAPERASLDALSSRAKASLLLGLDLATPSPEPPECASVSAQASNIPHEEQVPEQAAFSIELILVRHGQTPGNEEKRYVGIVDQPLSETGRAQARAAGSHNEVERVYVSRLRRTHETAALMFPNAAQIVVDGIEEMDFGAFAGRSPDEMADDPDYRAWVDGMCAGECPGGESQGAFTDRVCAALEALLSEAHARGEDRIVMVAHGGTMMAFLDRYGNDPSKMYWEWLVGNCEGYRIGVDITPGGVAVRSIARWEGQTS